MARKKEIVGELEKAVETQAQALEPAQREFVLAEFGTYKWNARHIEQLEKDLETGIVDEEGRHNYDAEGKLFRQRHQLVAEQSQLFSHIMRWLRGTTSEESPIDEFLAS